MAHAVAVALWRLHVVHGTAHGGALDPHAVGVLPYKAEKHNACNRMAKF